MLPAALALSSVMTWDPSSSPDASNCYYVFGTQRSVKMSELYQGYNHPFVWNYFMFNPLAVCGPPFIWTLPADPPPGYIQYFCIMAKDTSGNYSGCAEMVWAAPGSGGAQ